VVNVRRRRAVIAAALLSLAAACTTGSASTPHSVTTSTAPASVAGNPSTSTASANPDVLLLDCAQSDAAVPESAIVLNAVGLDSGHVLGASKTGEKRRDVALFSKVGLFVRAGVAVDLSIRGAQGRATMGWGWDTPTGGWKQVHAPACPAIGDNPWVVWAGGFWLPKPRCVHVRLTVGTRQAEVPMSVGRKCDG
jgi:hypothetical protein